VLAANQPPEGSPDLAPILDSLRADRATGCLRVTSGARQANLYLLFGHVYHAAGPVGTGDAALAEASSWSPVSVQLDTQAKLPSIETVKAPGSRQPDFSLSRQELLDQYASAPPVDTTDPSRLVIPLSATERVLRGGAGAILLVCALVAVVYVQPVPVELMAAFFGFLGIILVWWAMTWKLILTPTGFEVVGMLTRKRRRWADVAAFETDVSTWGRRPVPVVHFRDSPSFMVGSMQSEGKWRWALGTLGNSFPPRGMSAAEQVKLLEEWRARYSP